MRTLRFASLVVALYGLSGPYQAGAEIVRIEVMRVGSSPADGAIPAYRTLTGRAFGELDPQAPDNLIIQDLLLAPRNARGRVEYATDFTLSIPEQEDSKRNVLLFEAPNRGTPLGDLAFAAPDETGVARNVLQQQRLIVLRSGWQADSPRAPAQFGGRTVERLALDVPVARNVDGSPITGPVRAEIIVNEQGRYSATLTGSFMSGHRTYAPVTLEDPSAVLTYRRREADSRQTIPRDQWRFADCSSTPFPGAPSATHVCLTQPLDPDFIYEVVYMAKDPLVQGIGFAATRDLVSFLRYAERDGQGNSNPVYGRISHAIGLGISQSGNFVRTLVHLGFNRDTAGRTVFEGLMPIVATRTNPLNVRFGQPGRGAGQHEDHLYPGHGAPSSWASSQDQVANRKAGVLDRCTVTGTCPRVMQVYTASEYWQLQGSPVHVDALGQRDLELPSNVRLYFIASAQHTPAAKPEQGICTQLNNPVPTRETHRALLTALLQWTRDGVMPPDSVYPRLSRRELVAPSKVAWPAIPGVSFHALANPMPLLDFGPEFNAQDESGVVSVEPPRIRGEYTILVPQVDADGNDLGGIRTTTTAAPLGTYTGWNYRKAGFSEGELCSLNGSFIPFRRTRAERIAAGDPRPSLEERYGNRDGYLRAVSEAAVRLQAQRLLLPEDAARLVREARAVRW